MEFINTKVPDVILVKSKIFEDQRGFFMESFHIEKFKSSNINTIFVQDNHSRSKKHTLRGLHFQYPNLQGKLISVLNGRIFDVVVDIRKGSPTFGKWFSVILNSKKKRLLWIPEGFAHGYLVLSKSADVSYCCTCKYYPKNQNEIIWNDPFINIKWPIKKPAISKKDANGIELNKIKNLPKWKK